MTVTTVTSPVKGKPVRLRATLGLLRTLKGGKLTVTLITDDSELKKVLELVTACQTGHVLAITARPVQSKDKKDAKKKSTPKKRTTRYPYRNSGA